MKVLVADDHPLVRDALLALVARLGPRVQASAAADFPGLLRLAAAGDHALALVDLNMPGMDGLQALRRLRQLAPLMKVVVVSGQVDPITARAALDAGAADFLPKTASADRLLQALQQLQHGGGAGAALTTCMVPTFHVTSHEGPADARPAGDAPRLTPRQRQVLQLLARGEPNSAIAAELGLSEGTVKLHIAAILRTLRVRNRTEAALRARTEEG